MTPADKVRIFVQQATRHSEVNRDRLVNALIDKGISPLDAECLLAFVPIAFTQGLFEGFDVRFQPGYEIRDPQTGVSANGLLQKEPFFIAARRLAAKMVKGDELACKIVMQVAGLSPELDLINQKVRKGTAVADIELTEPVLSRLPVEYLTKRKPWWKFWR
jgi:hypothetical protein